MTSPRIATLDLVRGVAVMGILAANIAAFGLPESAYFSPAAYGAESRTDLTAWALTFVLVEGKMRGLFTFLFGASLLLVADRAEAGGERPAIVHYQRMTWLFLFGIVHLYLFWWGDILTHYALVGSVAFLFHRMGARWLAIVGAMCVAIQTIEVASSGAWLFALHAAAVAPNASPSAITTWQAFATAFGQPLPGDVARELAAMRGSYAQVVAYRAETITDPMSFLPIIGAESLGYMLLGMAALKTGFLTGTWPRRRYATIAIVALGVTVPLYAALAWFDLRHGFDARFVFLSSMTAATPIRPVMVAGYAALIILLARPGGWLTTRIAAAGRMAFSNYLGTTLICTTLFYGYGFGLFGHVSRAGLYGVVAAIWVVMLAWSKPWLDRYRYGPLEWLWRSLARFAWQPMRGAANATS